MHGIACAPEIISTRSSVSGGRPMSTMSVVFSSSIRITDSRLVTLRLTCTPG